MKIVKYILLTIYLMFIALNTFFLFTFNEFSASIFGNNTILGLKEQVGDYQTGSLIMAKKDENIKIGDTIIYFNTEKGKKNVDISKVENILDNNEITYVIKDGLFISDKYVIAKNNSVTCIPFLGYLFNFFTSTIGYLIFVVIPIIGCFIYQLFIYKKVKHA